MLNPMKLQVVCGGQFGSEAKGHIAGFLAAQEDRPLCIRVAGPNAGHSVVNPVTGVRHALRQIPVGAVTNPQALLAIAAGSEIDFAVLSEEVLRLEEDGIKVSNRLIIDPAATVLEYHHAATEDKKDLTDRIGSTSKGIGAARSGRVMREARTVRDIASFLDQGLAEIEPVADHVRMRIWSAIQIEGTQGYGLGLHTEYYPYVTSSDCTALDFLAMARINPWDFHSDDLEIWVVFRPYPIRVAGNSGPMFGETTWEALGLPPEQTTVTKKTRRVGLWDAKLAQAAIAANGVQVGRRYAHEQPVRVALTMADQIDPALAGSTSRLDLIESATFSRFADRVVGDIGLPLSLVTTSDRTCVDLR